MCAAAARLQIDGAQPGCEFCRMAHEKYDRLIAAVKAIPAITTAVAHPCDVASLSGAVDAAKAGIIVPILVGPPARIRAAAPQAGHATCFHVGWWSSGLPGLEKSTSCGSSTGKCDAGTGTIPQASQWITGIGQPQ